MRTSTGGRQMDVTGSDHEARFDRLFDEHARSVLAYLLRRTGPADSDDALVEVFEIVWRRLDEIPADAERPWMFGVARRVLANQRRSHRRRLRLVESVGRDHRRRAAGSGDPASRTVTDHEPVLDAIARLADKDREVLLLIAWDGLSRVEAAEVAGCSPEAAKKRYQRAVERLRRELGPAALAGGGA